MSNPHYNILIFTDDEGSHRQLRLRKKAFWASLTASLAGVVLLGLGLAAFWPKSTTGPKTQALIKENEALKLANDRYLEASIQLEKKLKQFEEKTANLAMMVGVEPVDMNLEGLGGPDILDPELNRYLRYDLGLMAHKTAMVEDRFEHLEESFRSHGERLAKTPSTLPTRGWISSGFKFRRDPFTQKRTWHNGIDVSCPEGTPIYAPAEGVVSYRGFNGGFGNLLEIDHGDELMTRYGHLSKFNVRKGQRVRRGDLIGYVGSTGRSTSSHLHYEVHKADKAVNPMKFIVRDTKTY